MKNENAKPKTQNSRLKTGIKFCILSFEFWALSFSFANAAKHRLPQGDPKPPIQQDLPPPLNLQIQVVKKSAVVSWKWVPPDPMPEFLDFGFEVEREDGLSWILSENSLTDFNVDVGTYTYRVRVRGTSKGRGRRTSHVSRWIGPILAEIVPVCPDPPKASIKVEPANRAYSRAPSLRLKISGNVQNPADCHDLRAFYTVDSGTGLHRTGALKISPAGVINEFVDAVDSGEEIVSGGLTFTVTVTAENEAGLVTPGATTLSLQTENPYAPKEAF